MFLAKWDKRLTHTIIQLPKSKRYFHFIFGAVHLIYKWTDSAKVVLGTLCCMRNTLKF